MDTKKLILIDNGHGVDTKGKRSPDGTLLEWKYTREVAKEVVERLKRKGYNAALLTPEDRDISLSERCRRANTYCRQYGAANVCVVSIHLNAAGNGQTWMGAQGWQVCVSNNASLRSMKLAEDLFNAAKSKGVKVRRPSMSQNFWQQNLAICRDTNCPAVLTENFFMDNISDWRYLLSSVGKENVIKIHVDGIVNYVDGM